MTITEWINAATNKIDRLDAELILVNLLHVGDRSYLVAHDDEILSSNLLDLANAQLERRATGEPLAYILGWREFYGRRFKVTRSVLIPRPETETVIDLAKKAKPTKILDVGTGSGCIAITLALAGYRVTAFDISEQALRIARENAERLGAEVDFVQEDILHPTHKCGPFDIIVSNPPYICRSEATQMDENVLRYEPHLALFVPDDDPLRFYRAIVAYAEEHLVSGSGQMLFEVNRAYGRTVQELMRQAGYADVQLCQDQYGNDRIVKGRKT
jgi:release factor glutamine methyltransferase